MKQQLVRATVKLVAYAIVIAAGTLALNGVLFVSDGVWCRNYEEVQAGAALFVVLALAWIALTLHERFRTIEEDDDGDEDELEPDFIPSSVKPSKSNELQLWN